MIRYLPVLFLLFVVGCKEPTSEEAQGDLKKFLMSEEFAPVRAYMDLYNQADSKLGPMKIKADIWGVNANPGGSPERQRQEMLKAKVGAAEVRHIVEKIKSEKLLDNALSVIESNKAKVGDLFQTAKSAAEREGTEFMFLDMNDLNLRKQFESLESNLVKVESETDAVLGIR